MGRKRKLRTVQELDKRLEEVREELKSKDLTVLKREKLIEEQWALIYELSLKNE